MRMQEFARGGFQAQVELAGELAGVGIALIGVRLQAALEYIAQAGRHGAKCYNCSRIPMLGLWWTASFPLNNCQRLSNASPRGR